MIENKICSFTGHRKIPSEQYESIAIRLKEALINLIENDYCYFGAGGALGFDTLSAQTVLDLRLYYPHIKLILVLPCKTQTKGWVDEDVTIYEDIKSKADKVVCTSEHYTRGCMFKRNRHLINNANICVAYLTENKGGTAYTVEYAKSKNIQVINIAEEI